MSIRVLVDATAVPADRGGVGRYLDHVLACLDRDSIRLAIACQHDDQEVLSKLAPGAALLPLQPVARRRPVRLAWEQTGLALLAARTKPDVLWSPHYTTSLPVLAPRVVTLHDATFFSDPGVHLPTKARFFRAATKVAVRVADACVVPSQSTADQIAHYTGCDPAVMTVILHGVDRTDFYPPNPEQVAKFCAAHGLESGKYLAFLGTLEPRKNLTALIEGWVQASAGQAQPLPLVLAGGAGWDTNLDAVLAGVPKQLRVVRTGYLPLSDLPALLGGAALVAYPSLAEGFGLPVLEAMACGAAVLTTPRTALPEVGGDAVAYTEPDATSIGVALAGLLADSGRRDQLGTAALTRAGHLTWELSAAKHLEVFDRVARGRSR